MKQTKINKLFLNINVFNDRKDVHKLFSNYLIWYMNCDKEMPEGSLKAHYIQLLSFVKTRQIYKVIM